MESLPKLVQPSDYDPLLFSPVGTSNTGDSQGCGVPGAFLSPARDGRGHEEEAGTDWCRAVISNSSCFYHHGTLFEDECLLGEMGSTSLSDGGDAVTLKIHIVK